MIVDLDVREEIIVEYADARFLFQPLTSSEINLILQKHTRFKRGTERLNKAAAGRELFMRQLVRWENLKDRDGNEIPCTDEAKHKLWETKPLICNEILARFDEAQEAQEEACTKN